MITPDVYALRDQFHLPGMRVLQFAFDGMADNPNLPSNFERNTVVYTGTHDNATTRTWFEELPDNQRQNLWNYLKQPVGESGDAAPAFDEPGLVVRGGAVDGSVAGFAEPRIRGSDERARASGRELDLALHGRNALRSRIRMAARSDKKLEPVGAFSTFEDE